MKIKIGSMLYLGGDSDYQLSPPIQGLASPAIRVGDGLYAGRDGGFVSGHFYGHRTLVFQGFYVGASCEDAAELRETLLNLLRIRYVQPIVIYTENNNYYTEGVISNVKADIESLVAGKFQITILCPDPILYILDGGTAEINTWTTQSLTVSSSTTTQVGNSGSADDYPVITLTGIIANGVRITNTTTQRKMEIEIDTTQATDTLIVNMPKRIITLNGNLVNANRTTDSVWWTLIPGVNEIKTEALGTSDFTATLKHRKGRVGI